MTSSRLHYRHIMWCMILSAAAHMALLGGWVGDVRRAGPGDVELTEPIELIIDSARLTGSWLAIADSAGSLNGSAGATDAILPPGQVSTASARAPGHEVPAEFSEGTGGLRAVRESLGAGHQESLSALDPAAGPDTVKLEEHAAADVEARAAVIALSEALPPAAGKADGAARTPAGEASPSMQVAADAQSVPRQGASQGGPPDSHAAGRVAVLCSPGAAGAGVERSAGPAYKRRVDPHYPEAARRRGREGLVIIAADLDTHGAPTAARVAHSSGVEALDAAALEAVRKSTFEPALVGERAVPCSVQVPIQFRLQRRS
jgi:protein TonB